MGLLGMPITQLLVISSSPWEPGEHSHGSACKYVFGAHDGLNPGF